MKTYRRRTVIDLLVVLLLMVVPVQFLVLSLVHF